MTGALGKSVKKPVAKAMPNPVMTGDRGAGALMTPQPQQSAMPTEMNIRKLNDGTFHIRHTHSGKEPMAPSKEFSARNAKHLTRHVRQTFGNAGEED